MAFVSFAALKPGLRLGLIAALSLAAGCRDSASQDEPGFKLKVPDEWRPAARKTWSVPGTPLAAWSGPEGSSLVVYRALPIPGGTAEGLVVQRVNRIRNLPGFRIVVQKTETIAGEPAGRVEAIAPGNGDDLAPSGVGEAVALRGKPLVPTREITIGFVRPSETLSLVFRTPESAHDQIAPKIESILAGLALPPDRKPSSY